MYAHVSTQICSLLLLLLCGAGHAQLQQLKWTFWRHAGPDLEVFTSMQYATSNSTAVLYIYSAQQALHCCSQTAVSRSRGAQCGEIICLHSVRDKYPKLTRRARVPGAWCPGGHGP